MMNKSKIEWCDFSWNPVTGCLYDCKYCYAKMYGKRFGGDVRINKGSNQLIRDIEKDIYTLKTPFKNTTGKVIPLPVGFAPLLHEYRLIMPEQKKKPANILVCTLGELFGDWVPDSWLELVFDACIRAPHHNYLFLTRNPSRYHSLAERNILPNTSNFWYGTTVTTPQEPYFASEHFQTFLNIEPMLCDFGDAYNINADWVIVGAETGLYNRKTKPEKKWFETIRDICYENAIPLFMKSSKEFMAVWQDELKLELPDSLKRPDDKPIPHCEKCKHCISQSDGKRGWRYFCKNGTGGKGAEKKHIPGRYTRTSPPWCPLRQV